MKQSGMSLIEVMICSLLSIVMIQSLFEMFFANLTLSNFHETRSFAQDRAQHALFMIGNDLREAGSGAGEIGKGSYDIILNKEFTGVLRNVTNQELNACQAACDSDNSCQGFSWSSEFISAGSDSGLCRSSFVASNVIERLGRITYRKVINSVFYTGDCGGASCTSEGGGNLSDSLAISLDPDHNFDCVGGNVTGVVINRYFIAADDNSKNGLFCQSFNYSTGSVRGTRQLLVEGVEQLQLLYGFASSGGEAITSYRTADTIENWGYVRSVQVGVLVGGGDLWGNQGKSSRSYELLGSAALDLTDREPRYAYSMVQSLFSTSKDTSWRDRIFHEE